MFFSRLAALSVRLAEDLGSRLKADKDVCQIPGGPVPPPSLNPNTKVTQVVGCSGQIPPLSQSLIHELTKTGQSACAAFSQVSLLHSQCLPCKQDKVTKSRLSAPVKQALSLPYHCSHRHHPRERISLGIPGWPRAQRSTCLCPPSAGINGVGHQCPSVTGILKHGLPAHLQRSVVIADGWSSLLAEKEGLLDIAGPGPPLFFFFFFFLCRFFFFN